MERSEWLEERRKGIGGSDAATVLGISPWKSRLTLWSEKVGLIPDADLSANESVEWGNRLEAVVADKFQEMHPEFEVIVEPNIMRNSKYPFMLGNVDRLVKTASGVCGLEIKTVGVRGAADWDEGVPMHYLTQVHHYMVVTGMKEWYVACLVGGQRYVEHLVLADEAFQARLVEEERKFWSLVESKTMPQPDGSDDSSDTIKALFPQAQDGTTIELPTDAEGLLQMRTSLKDQISENEATLKSIENRIKLMLGAAECGIIGKYQVKWSNWHKDSYTVAASSGRTMRIKVGK